MTTNARSKVLEYLYKDSPSNKNNIGDDLKIAYATLDKALTDLRKEGYVKSNGNGYWTITIEGKEQYETDPNLPAIQQSRDSNRVFSLNQSTKFIENDYYCQIILNTFNPEYYDPNLLLPIVLLWLRCTNQTPVFNNKVESEPPKSKYSDKLQEFVYAVADLTPE